MGRHTAGRLTCPRVDGDYQCLPAGAVALGCIAAGGISMTTLLASRSRLPGASSPKNGNKMKAPPMISKMPADPMWDLTVAVPARLSSVLPRMVVS